jgi:hypothetical protein
MTQPYGQPPDPSGGYPQSGGLPQGQGYPQAPGYPQTPPGGYPQTPPGGYQQTPPGGYPQAPAPAYGYGSMPAAPPEYSNGPQRRPGTVTAAAVLAFVQAGITLIPTIIFFAALLQVGAAAGGDVALLWVATIAQIIGSALLIAGGVQIMGGKGRTLMVAATVIELAVCLLWVIMAASADSRGIDSVDYGLGFVVAFAIFFAVMPTISLVMALGTSTTQFVQSRRGH